MDSQVTFLKWFEIVGILNNSNVKVQNIVNVLSNSVGVDTVKDMLFSGLKKYYHEKNNIIHNVHSSLITHCKQNNVISDKQNNVISLVFNIDNLHFSILKYLDFALLSKCTMINKTWLYKCYDCRATDYFQLNHSILHRCTNILRFRHSQHVEINSVGLNYAILDNFQYFNKIKRLWISSDMLRNTAIQRLFANNAAHIEYLRLQFVTESTLFCNLLMNSQKNGNNWTLSNVKEVHIDNGCDYEQWLPLFLSKLRKIEKIKLDRVGESLSYYLNWIANSDNAKNIKEIILLEIINSCFLPRHQIDFTFKKQLNHIKIATKHISKDIIHQATRKMADLLIYNQTKPNKSIIARKVELEGAPTEVYQLLYELYSELHNAHNPYKILELIKIGIQRGTCEDISSLLYKLNQMFCADKDKFDIQILSSEPSEFPAMPMFRATPTCTLGASLQLKEVLFQLNKLNMKKTISCLIKFELDTIIYEENKDQLFHDLELYKHGDNNHFKFKQYDNICLSVRISRWKSTIIIKHN